MTAAEFFEVAAPVAAVASNEPVERVNAEAMDGNLRKGAKKGRLMDHKPAAQVTERYAFDLRLVRLEICLKALLRAARR